MSSQASIKDLSSSHLETRAIQFCLGLSAADEAYFKDLIYSYAHLQNMYILIRDELYKRADPEKWLARFEQTQQYLWKKSLERGEVYTKKTPPELDASEDSRAKFTLLLYHFSNPTVIRALFQSDSPDKSRAWKVTFEKNLKEKDPEGYEKYVAEQKVRFEKKIKSKKKPLEPREAANLLSENLAFLGIFCDFLSVGRTLKSHVIYNLMKTLKTAYKSAFTKYRQSGIFHPPRAKALAALPHFFIELCSNSVRLSDGKILLNLASKSRIMDLPRQAHEKFPGLLDNIQSMKIGVLHGKIVATIPYQKSISSAGSPPEPKDMGLDLGINRFASFFIDDEQSPSIAIDSKEYVAYNSIFNEKLAFIQGALDSLSNIKEEIRKTCGLTKKDLKNLEVQNGLLQDLNQSMRHLRECREGLYRDRQNFFKDLFHKLAIRILENAAHHKVSKIIISRNLGLAKQNGKGLRQKVRRRFHQIPILKLLDYIALNAQEFGIVISYCDEAYTSKTSAVHGDVLKAQSLGQQIAAAKKAQRIEDEDALRQELLGTALGGSRVKGAFKVSSNRKNCTYFHADIGAAANHIVVDRGTPITWTKDKEQKLFRPIVIKLRNILNKKHGITSEIERQREKKSQKHQLSCVRSEASRPRRSVA